MFVRSETAQPQPTLEGRPPRRGDRRPAPSWPRGCAGGDASALTLGGGSDRRAGPGGSRRAAASEARTRQASDRALAAELVAGGQPARCRGWLRAAGGERLRGDTEVRLPERGVPGAGRGPSGGAPAAADPDLQAPQTPLGRRRWRGAATAIDEPPGHPGTLRLPRRRLHGVAGPVLVTRRTQRAGGGSPAAGSHSVGRAPHPRDGWWWTLTGCPQSRPVAGTDARSRQATLEAGIWSSGTPSVEPAGVTAHGPPPSRTAQGQRKTGNRELRSPTLVLVVEYPVQRRRQNVAAVLELTLPLTETAKPRRIAIGTGSNDTVENAHKRCSANRRLTASGAGVFGRSRGGDHPCLWLRRRKNHAADTTTGDREDRRP